MSYTWLDICKYGDGRVRFALIIEGWPEIWVTDHSLTLTNSTYGAQGRTVRVGLRREGLQFSERALLLQGKIEASAMTFRIVSGDHTKQAVASFATVPTVLAELDGDLETSDTTITLRGTALGNGDYYHIGTEVIRGGSEGAITRAHWDTQAQSFYLLDGQDQLTHQIYSRPRTMEGRRATLYVWGDGDDSTRYDPTGAQATYGHPVWRGVVSLPPRLERDGVTWSITADHVSTVFRQSLAARSTEIKPVGIQFNSGAPFAIGLFGATTGKLMSGKRMLFMSKDVSAFCTTVNNYLTALIADTSTDLDNNFSSIIIQQDKNGAFYLRAFTTGSPSGLASSPLIDIRSHLTGWARAGSGATPWLSFVDGTTVGTISNDFDASSYYRCDFLVEPAWTTEQPSGSVQPAFGLPSGGSLLTGNSDMGMDSFGAYDYALSNGSAASESEVSEWSRRRIFIDRDWSTLSSRGIVIMRSDIESRHDEPANQAYLTEEALAMEVIDDGFDSDYDAHWIAVRKNGLTQTFHGWLHSESIIRPTYATQGATDVVGFVYSVLGDVAANANDGNLPFIRDTDFDTTTTVSSSLGELVSERTYSFVKPVALEDVIAEELKLIGYMWSTNKNSAKLTFVPIPILTGGIAATRDDAGTPIAIGRAQTHTPSAGSGSFPGYEIQSQGIVSTVIIKDGYDAANDEHKGIPHYRSDPNLLSTHKRRGLTDLTIAPKSTAPDALSDESATVIAARMMAVLGREYVSVKVRVPFTRFRTMLGDIVTLTSPHVPNSTGGMGITNKKALVIGRHWNLDTGKNEHGELELLMLLEEPAGYTPSGVITGQSGSTTTWTLTLSAANTTNILISPRGDGDVAGTFAVGDEIRIVQQDSTGPTIRTGNVTSVSGATVGVTLDSSWTPSTLTWHLEYASATTAVSSQLEYCFVADENLLINNANAARRFS